MSIRRSLCHPISLCVLLTTSACSADAKAPRETARVAMPPVAPAVARETSSAALVAQQGDTSGAPRSSPKVRLLSDAEQRVADGLVFAPSTTARFVVAARNKRLLVDVGRVDLDVKQDPALVPLVRRISARIGPLARTSQLRVRGTWGEETDSITGYDVWNGRAVAVLAASARTDSLLKRNAPLVGVATRALADSAPSAAPTCVRDSVPPELPARVAVVRDSLVRWMTDSLKSPFERLAKATAVRGDAAIGCFGGWRAVVIVTSRTPSLEWNEERALLVAGDGKVSSARLRDLRLRAHESLVAFDADGDGVDELAARGLATRMGAQSVLKLDSASRRFSRYASGFAWESR
jgi:hypothetical protein